MRRLDYVDGTDPHDTCLFYFDGVYAGHDDQVEYGDLAAKGTKVQWEVAHWVLREEWDGEHPDHFEDLLPLVVPLADA